MQVNSTAINAMSNWMNNSAHNVANVNTKDFKAIDTTINDQGNAVVAQSSVSNSSTDLATEFTDQTLSSDGLSANVKAMKTQDEMIGSLLDISI